MDKKNFCLRDFGGDLSQRWFVQYKDNGRWKKSYISAKLLTHEARNKEAQYIIAALQGKPKPVKYAYLEKLRSALEVRLLGARPKTKQTYLSKFNTFETYCRQNVVPVFDAIACDKFFLYLRGKRGLHNTTVNAYVDLMKSLFEDCGVSPNPFEKCVHFKNSKTPALYFQQHQRKRIATEMQEKEPYLWLFVQFIFYGFIRPGEIRLLTVGDIYPEECKILVRADIAKNKKRQFVHIPKPLMAAIYESDVLSFQPNYYLFSASLAPASGPMGARYMALRHQNLLKHMGFDTAVYKLYSWKHTGAVACCKAGMKLKDLQLQMRHASIEETDGYLRSLGINDVSSDIDNIFPTI